MRPCTSIHALASALLARLVQLLVLTNAVSEIINVNCAYAKVVGEILERAHHLLEVRVIHGIAYDAMAILHHLFSVAVEDSGLGVRLHSRGDGLAAMPRPTLTFRAVF